MRVATIRRAATLLLPGALLAAAVTALPTGSAQAQDGTYYWLRSPAGAAATWTIGQLTDGTHADADPGLTADVVLGLAATGTGGEAAERATDWLAENADDYLHPFRPGKVRVTAAAKLALVASVQGRDPADFGGHDLITMLHSRLGPDGRFRDGAGRSVRHSRFDTSDRISQSLAVLALARTGDVPEHAVDRLAAGACPDGGYPLALSRWPGAGCLPETDATALTVQALIAAGRTAEAEPAVEWLLGQGQDRFGDYGPATQYGRTANSPVNAVSTARAAQAMVAADRSFQEQYEPRMGTELFQHRCDAPDKSLRGAVPFDRSSYPAEPSLSATALAMPALAGTWLFEIDGTAAAPEPHEIYCYSDWATTGTPSVGGDGGIDGGGIDGGSSGSSGSAVSSEGSYSVSTSTTSEGTTSEGSYSVSTTSEGSTSEGSYSVSTSTTSEGTTSEGTDSVSTTIEGGYSVSTSTSTEGSSTSEGGYSVSTTSEGSWSVTTTSEGSHTASTATGGSGSVSAGGGTSGGGGDLGGVSGG
ncbi:hypothetical protein [Streptomyces aidingensis]|uniref:Prenyltransferase and squalene oxidase repeat-containing protein n=1 Tax=Streptomyces aidingensis TaxID=910347 RepID=A0A1I1KEY5_9ACTN|nr:hypothetical protein [Streptomyces aidingensis]SFC56050.1 hypothetical protein SAMN05421773_10493 [Streptomyces aidingensis]